MIKIDMNTDDIDKQLELLKYYPEVVVKHFKPALQRVVISLENMIRPKVPLGRTERLINSLGSKIRGKGIGTLQGNVGFIVGRRPKYVSIVEDGAQEHEIFPRDGNKISMDRYRSGKGAASALSWASGYDGGDFVFRKAVHHPGVAGKKMMASAVNVMEPMTMAEFGKAAEATLKEMEVK